MGDINTAVNLNVVIITCYAQANNVQVLSAGGGQIVVINIQRAIKGNGIAVTPTTTPVNGGAPAARSSCP